MKREHIKQQAPSTSAQTGMIQLARSPLCETSSAPRIVTSMWLLQGPQRTIEHIRSCDERVVRQVNRTQPTTSKPDAIPLIRESYKPHDEADPHEMTQDPLSHPRIMAKDCELEKIDEPGSVVTVSLPALIRSGFCWPGLG